VGQTGPTGRSAGVPEGPSLHQHDSEFYRITTNITLTFRRKTLLCLIGPLVSPLIGQCVIIGAGPCGLRTAVELSFMGARVVVLEKRDSFSRNNVLHLWPFTIHDLRGLGAKKFHGKFSAGSIDHISECVTR